MYVFVNTGICNIKRSKSCHVTAKHHQIGRDVENKVPSLTRKVSQKIPKFQVFSKYLNCLIIILYIIKYRKKFIIIIILYYYYYYTLSLLYFIL